MRFVLSAHGGSDLHFAQGAVVVLHRKDREQLLRRKALFLGLRAYENDLVYMEYADSVEWIESFSDTSLAEKVEAEHLVIDPRGGSPFGEALSGECETCVIDQQGVYWSCLVKHTEVWVETTLIPWDLIEGKE
ncbi:MAG: hypothetical protein WC372_10775 [Candidatus Neomarinimicrobiota bacterium]|jgi:hypothetical protein